MGKILAELRQSKPFPRPEPEALVTLLRTSDVVRGRIEETLKPWGLSPEQYNVLRILRGAPDGCHPTLEIAARMVSRAPNITRLIDKLIRKGLVTRCGAEGDRRVVMIRIAPAGQKVLAEATPALDRVNVACGGGLSPAKLRTLIRSLNAIRKAARDG